MSTQVSAKEVASKALPYPGGECVRSRFYGQATKGVCVDALAQEGDEGRGQLRKASGSRSQAMIRGYPNGETQWV